jgi:hypothetical protein
MRSKLAVCNNIPVILVIPIEIAACWKAPAHLLIAMRDLLDLWYAMPAVGS